MAETSLSIPVETLLERKAKLEDSFKNDEPVKARRMTRNGSEWYVLDRQAIQNEILQIDLELEKRKREQEKEDEDVKAGFVIRTHGPAVIEFLKLKASEQTLKKSESLIKTGKDKIASDEKRSKTMKGKVNECPIDHFEIQEIVDVIRHRNLTATEIGLFLFHGNKDFGLHQFTAESLHKAFAHGFNRSIAIRTWQKWKAEKITKQKRLAFAKKFSETKK